MNWRHSRIRVWLNRAYYVVANPIRRAYWFVRRPRSRGAKCVATWNNTFLLIRPTYAHRKWTFPGGGVGDDESFEAGALRELKEETGLAGRNPCFIGSYDSTQNYRTDTVHVFVVEVDDPTLDLDPSEIAEARWFSLEDIPREVPSVERILKMYTDSISHEHH